MKGTILLACCSLIDGSEMNRAEKYEIITNGLLDVEECGKILENY